jgi:hypothetical protein
MFHGRSVSERRWPVQHPVAQLSGVGWLRLQTASITVPVPRSGTSCRAT